MNKYANDTIIKLVDKFEPLLSTIKRRNMSYYGHTCRHSSMTKTILQGNVEGSRIRGRPKKIGCQILLCGLRRRWMNC